MTRPARRILLGVGLVVGAGAMFAAGVSIGLKYERDRFEVAKLFSVEKADDYLTDGKPAKALAALHFAKAYESLRGDTDALLAKAYLADAEPCLAQAFAESHLRYMERNKLTTFSSYESTRNLYQRAAAQCATTALAAGVSTSK